DGSVLEEAEKLIEQIRVQFPREAQANADLLDRAAREVRYRKAEREWLMARFYDRRKAYQAARFYYQIIQRDYQDTPFAQQAQTRMAEIRDKPPHPPQYMRWLVKLFPSSEPETPLLKSGNSVRR
ncbi:MAG TPA: outer membrane protein assembly factor BamD, partial [Planctomycetaceae bacterium]|nr:outer membrane protein assembly factor BamD [Planctomycetaceae bacterium]